MREAIAALVFASALGCDQHPLLHQDAGLATLVDGGSCTLGDGISPFGNLRPPRVDPISWGWDDTHRPGRGLMIFKCLFTPTGDVRDCVVLSDRVGFGFAEATRLRLHATEARPALCKGEPVFIKWVFTVDGPQFY
jgi:hypothetical protein